MKKIYVDTHFKTKDSVSNTNFRIQLLQPLELKEDARCFVSDINIPNSWYSIEDTNNNLYVQVVEGSTVKHQIIQLTKRNYSVIDLASEIQSKLNAALNKTFNITYNGNIGKLTFNVLEDNFSYSILTDDELKNLSLEWKGRYYNPNNVKSCNDVLNNYTSQLCSKVSPYVSGFVNVINYDSLYIRSNLSSLDHIGPDGSQCNIIKKISTISGFGTVMTNYNVNVNDYSYIRNRNALTVLEFTITDLYGNVIDLHGGHVSFTINFLDD